MTRMVFIAANSTSGRAGARGQSRRERLPICVGRVLALVVAMALASAITAHPSGAAPRSTQAGDVHQHPSETGPIDAGCPSKTTGLRGPSFYLLVTHWCSVSGPHRQIQIKLQLKVTNNRHSRRLSLALGHFYLAVPHLDASRWEPPEKPADERPFRSTWEGHTYWLIPATPNGAAEPYPPPQGNYTFATHWNAPASLAPGQTFTPSYHRGDIVFFVPHAKGTLKLKGVGGIAYVSGRDILDLCDHWGKKDPHGAASF